MNNEAYLSAAHDAVKSVLSQTTSSDINSVDINSLADILIENVGRFCEDHHSDFLITWDYIRNLIKQPIEQDTRDIIVFAIRRVGVDSNTYLQSNLETYKNDHGRIQLLYRKIYSMNIIRTIDGRITCDLKDVTSEIEYQYRKQSSVF